MFALSELVDSDDGGAVRTSISQVAAACHAMGAVQCVRSNATLMQLVDQVHLDAGAAQDRRCTGQMTGLLLLEKVDKAALLLLNRPHQGGERGLFCGAESPFFSRSKRAGGWWWARWRHQRLRGGRPQPPTHKLPQWDEEDECSFVEGLLINDKWINQK